MHSPFASPNTTLLAIPPRSYYLSTNTSPTQAGLLKDYAAVLQHARATYPSSKLVIYSHSLGASASCVLLASQPRTEPRTVDALLLESPFPSISTMIAESLYPSKILPYHWLTPFVLDKWDALEALRNDGGGGREGTALDQTDIIFISSELDTLVEPELVRRMYEASKGTEGGGRREWLSIKERSHDDAWAAKGDWGAGVGGFLRRSGVLEVERKKKKT